MTENEWMQDELQYLRERIDKLSNDTSHIYSDIAKLKTSMELQQMNLKHICKEVKSTKNYLMILLITIIGSMITGIYVIV